MKALVFTKYGSPQVLQLQEISKPVPEEHQVLIKVHATAVNDYDWSLIRGKPYVYRLMFGLLKPKVSIPGMELAGTIEAIGKNVTLWKPGDAVYGDISEFGFGSFAEYVCVHEKAVVSKPGKMSFEEAAAIPHASMLALQGLHMGQVRDGQQILINGAGGGVGTFGLQLAKLHHAEVTGVDTGKKLKMMESLGFDHIIDYRQEDFTKNEQQYDLILDTKTNRSPFAYAGVLKPRGYYVTVGGSLPRLLQTLVLGPFIHTWSKKNLRIVALKPNQDLNYMNELYEAGKIKCIIDGPYALDELPRLIQYFGEGKHHGKVVISMDE